MAPIETTTADSHLRAIAEPHERMPPSLHKLESTTTWVSAYPAAMLQMASRHSGEGTSVHHASDTKHVHKEEHKVHEKKVEKKSYEEQTKDKLRKGKEKVKEEIKEKKDDKKESKSKAKSGKAHIEEAEDKAREEYQESSSIAVPLAEVWLQICTTLTLARDVVFTFALPCSRIPPFWANFSQQRPQHEDPFDHPVFVHRTVEHSSLDIRAQLSLERRADLQCQDSFELPGMFVARSRVNRGYLLTQV